MNSFIAPFPMTTLEWGIEIVASVVISYVLISTVEYIFHRFVMHQGFWEPVYVIAPPLGNLLYDHRKLHHETYYQEFNHEPDPHGREVNQRLAPWHTVMGALFSLPYILLTLWLISPVPAIIFFMLAAAHNILWNTIHPEMHNPRYPFWTKWAPYKLLARRHYLHHKHTLTNYNIVCPFMDYVVGTVPEVSPEDEEKIRQMGFSKS